MSSLKRATTPAAGLFTGLLVVAFAASGPVTLQIDLPDGVTTRVAYITTPSTNFTPTPWYAQFGRSTWSCDSAEAGKEQLNCTPTLDPVLPHSQAPGGQEGARFLTPLTVYVQVEPGTTGPLTATATLSGGGADPLTVTETATMGPEPTDFGIEAASFEADALDENAIPERQAGEHPERAFVEFDFNRRGMLVPDWTTAGLFEAAVPYDYPREIVTRVPRGFVGNPQAVAECEPARFAETCPPSSQVGILEFAAYDRRSMVYTKEMLLSLEPAGVDGRPRSPIPIPPRRNVG